MFGATITTTPHSSVYCFKPSWTLFLTHLTSAESVSSMLRIQGFYPMKEWDINLKRKLFPCGDQNQTSSFEPGWTCSIPDLKLCDLSDTNRTEWHDFSSLTHYLAHAAAFAVLVTVASCQTRNKQKKVHLFVQSCTTHLCIRFVGFQLSTTELAKSPELFAGDRWGSYLKAFKWANPSACTPCDTI